MDAHPSDFPFDILDVAQLTGLRIRRRQGDSVYTDCPFCGDTRGKMNLHLTKNVWRCNYCGAHGGMLALYAQLHHTTNGGAYREICDALSVGETGWGCENADTAAKAGASCGEPPAVPRAPAQTVHQTLSLLFGMLSLRPQHRAHLKSRKRGLTDRQIDRLGFKSTPPYSLCRSLTARLIAQGCTVEGVPGFFRDKQGQWTVAFSTYTAGILIPSVGLDGLFGGAQILLDVPFKRKDDPPEKAGTKYIWFSSASKPMGTGAGSPVHFVGDPSARVVYVTEGLLKADIAHCLTGRSFAAVAGANNVRGLDEAFSLMAQNGTELIIEAHDMDKYSNAMTAKGSSEIFRMARAHGLSCRRLTWNPNYKGIDDWQLALRRQKQAAKPPAACAGAPEHTQRFRLYQLAVDEAQHPIPFAFRDSRALHKAGFEQPPAALYRLVWDASLPREEAQTDTEFLQNVRRRCQNGLPPDQAGRPMAASDVIELYDLGCRRYFYTEPNSFIEVRFSPFLAKKIKNKECFYERSYRMAGSPRDGQSL